MNWREITLERLLLTVVAGVPFLLGYGAGLLTRAAVFLFAALKAGFKAGAGLSEE